MTKRRLGVVRELVARGIDPYPHRFDFTHTVGEIRRLAREQDLPVGEVSTVGRVLAIRRHGRTTFIDVHDDASRLQCQIRVDVVGEEGYDFLRRYVERGDFVGVLGEMFYTRMDELTLKVEDLKILSKVLYDIPRAWYGLKRVETRYRQRHLDLLLNPEVRDIFVARSRIIGRMRDFFRERGFLEVETPLIQEFYGGATARPFTTHVNCLDEDRYLQISPELYLKRLVVGGLNRVFTVSKNFRNEEIDATHNPEFTTLEAYEAYADYNDVMRLTEDLFTNVASDVWGSLRGEYDGVELDFSPPWRRMTMYGALDELADLDVKEMSDEEIQSTLRRNDPHNYQRLISRGGYNRGLFVAQLFDHFCQNQLVQPTLVTDYPKETVPLSKAHREDPDLIERFELFVCGMEVANAYTELNDPLLQERLFLEEAERGRGEAEAHLYDEGYVEALRYGMPPTGGLGVGLDRVVMLLTGQTSIKEVILFPMMRRINKDPKKKT